MKKRESWDLRHCREMAFSYAKKYGLDNPWPEPVFNKALADRIDPATGRVEMEAAFTTHAMDGHTWLYHLLEAWPEEIAGFPLEKIEEWGFGGSGWWCGDGDTVCISKPIARQGSLIITEDFEEVYRLAEFRSQDEFLGYVLWRILVDAGGYDNAKATMVGHNLYLHTIEKLINGERRPTNLVLSVNPLDMVAPSFYTTGWRTCFAPDGDFKRAPMKLMGRPDVAMLYLYAHKNELNIPLKLWRAYVWIDEREPRQIALAAQYPWRHDELADYAIKFAADKLFPAKFDLTKTVKRSLATTKEHDERMYSLRMLPDVDGVYHDPISLHYGDQLIPFPGSMEAKANLELAS